MFRHIAAPARVLETNWYPAERDSDKARRVAVPNNFLFASVNYLQANLMSTVLRDLWSSGLEEESCRRSFSALLHTATGKSQVVEQALKTRYLVLQRSSEKSNGTHSAVAELEK